MHGGNPWKMQYTFIIEKPFSVLHHYNKAFVFFAIYRKFRVNNTTQSKFIDRFILIDFLILTGCHFDQFNVDTCESYHRFSFNGHFSKWPFIRVIKSIISPARKWCQKDFNRFLVVRCFK